MRACCGLGGLSRYRSGLAARGPARRCPCDLGANGSGFTLLEIVIVLAAMGVLLAMLVPRGFTYILDAQRTEAQNAANQIAQAISKFGEDTALLPYKNNTNAVKVGAKEGGDFDCLHGSEGATVTTALDTGGTWTSGSGIGCQEGSSTRDTIENHLIKNTPGGDPAKAYATSGGNAWRGPYLPSVPADPWGNVYLVNVGKGDPAASTRKGVWVISAGPNGDFQTGSDANASGLVTAAGDDIIARVR